ncbi:glycosyltransferase [Leptospira levettii]|uniref:Glycosyltransferase n=1 Tax=Leptospira levettii TaxID=2023178 RepID=A0AAW5V1T0_9LEPT|nr:glycosyltransferase [Leptospira levettii]MCW7466534.1 glycosyltransferase [Leptospira levettii]MCW7497351.1 glycosyltransferase [Leptospira levettii]MCW7511900.1 glycosyltransferase [Leptospira levettii]MCW7515660.1 glycosyltransferase [Leptospira levettii]TGL66953.1 glycosyltransferase [Leptospira levettii]
MSSKTPLISIVIPTYNRQHLIERAVQSVFRQTYPHWELHIIDDGSTDNTWSFLLANLPSWKRQIQSFGRNNKSIQIHQTEHRGVSHARNFGIGKSVGEWISLLDSDDEWYPEKLTKQIEFHHEHPEILFSQTKEVWNKKGNLLEPKGKYQKRSGDFLKESLEICMVTCSSFMAHKKTWESVGNFREEMKTCEDYDLWNRILLKQYPIGLLAENLLVRYGGHEDQLSNQFQAVERFRLYSLLSTRNEQISNGESIQNRNHLSEENQSFHGNSRILLKEAILERMDTLVQGRKKRGKDVQFLTHFQSLFLKDEPIPQKDLLTLLDDSLF